MLYIEREDNPKLLNRFHEIHNTCVLLHDQILEVLDYEELIQTKFNYDPESQILIDKLKNKEINVLEWLKENKLNEEIKEFLTKEITRATTADFSKFIYHALSAAKNGQMSVAYSLLRKPLTDELLILEQLLQDPDDFINRFFWIGNPKEYDPSSRNIDKKQIIKKATARLKPSGMFDSDFIYKLRYDKEFDSGLNGISNQALHIVTQDKNYKTLEQNLNFVFSNKADIESYWEHFYKLLPYLLIYAYSIIDSILFNYINKKESDYLEGSRFLYRFCAFLKYTELFVDLEKEYKLKNTNLIVFNCPKCENEFSFDKADSELFLESKLILCPKCFTNILELEENKKKINEWMNSFKIIGD